MEEAWDKAIDSRDDFSRLRESFQLLWDFNLLHVKVPQRGRTQALPPRGGHPQLHWRLEKREGVSRKQKLEQMLYSSFFLVDFILPL